MENPMANGAYITTPIITIYQHPYELHKQHTQHPCCCANKSKMKNIQAIIFKWMMTAIKYIRVLINFN
jgi:hypothetical protein